MKAGGSLTSEGSNQRELIAVRPIGTTIYEDNEGLGKGRCTLGQSQTHSSLAEARDIGLRLSWILRTQEAIRGLCGA